MLPLFALCGRSILSVLDLSKLVLRGPFIVLYAPVLSIRLGYRQILTMLKIPWAQQAPCGEVIYFVSLDIQRVSQVWALGLLKRGCKPDNWKCLYFNEHFLSKHARNGYDIAFCWCLPFWLCPAHCAKCYYCQAFVFVCLAFNLKS